MAKAIFTKGAVTRQLSADRVWPISDAPTVAVVMQTTETGKLYVYNKGFVEQEFSLTFKNLSYADDVWLRSFFSNTVVGPLNTFTYTDGSGNNHTVRWMDTKYPIVKEESQSSTQRYEGTITLREEI